MDITVYLPDDIGERAKKEDLKLSRMLRDAVIDELERRDAMTDALSTATTYEVDVVDEQGYAYIGRITGTRIAGDEQAAVYLTTDKRVIAYESDECTYLELKDPASELRGAWILPDEYAVAMKALGIKPVIDL